MCATGCGGCNDCGGVELPDGPAGIDGKNSFTVTTGAFNVPAIGADRTINVSALGQATGTWAVAGQTIFIEGAGYYEVVSSTHTTITATNLGTTGNAAPTSLIALGAGVSPAGVPGVDGVDGASELVTLYSATAASTTSFTVLHTAQTIPANTFQTVGDIMRVTFTSVGDYVAANTSTNYWRYEHKITLGGVDIILPASNPYFIGKSTLPFNGLSVEVDIIPLAVGATPTFIVNINKFQIGLGLYNGTDGYLVIPSNTNAPSYSGGNPFASGVTSGIAATTTALTFQMYGRRTAVGSPTGTPSVYLPSLKIQMIKK